MRRYLLFTALLTMMLGCLALPSLAERATAEEAATVAGNWVELIIREKGNWGESPSAEVGPAQDFRKGGRTLGYFFPVQPQGFIVVSLHKELASVKAYSDSDSLDPLSDEGMADLIKGGMDRVITAAERKVGNLDHARPEDIGRAVEINYRRSWDELASREAAAEIGLTSEVLPANYVSGSAMLTSAWHQGDPYNRQCPAGSTCSHTLVGCVALAGAQLMRYWCWPPYGEGGSPYTDTHSWPNMPDTLTGTSPSAQIDAVAELCREIGIAVGMSYGCDISLANTYNMEGVYENHYRYSTSCVRRDRNDYTAVDWFNRMKTQFNANRPIQYRVEGHSIVSDGWQEIGATPLRQYHMNYGWSNASWNTWYTLDALELGGVDVEYMLEAIVPDVALGSSVAGTYARQSFPYRYVDRDATAASGGTFESGQLLQFLPNTSLACSSASYWLSIHGSTTLNTRLFTRGDTSAGVLIQDGTIRMANGGVIILR